MQRQHIVKIDIREQFELPEGIYLANHGVGCLPRKAREASQQFFDSWAQHGVKAWHHWLEEVENYQASLAKLLGGHSHEYCPQRNISSALTKIVSSLPNRKNRKKILTSKHAFPSIGFVLQRSGQTDYQTQFAHETTHNESIEYWEQLLTDDIQAVVLMHGYSNLGSLCPIQDIIELAKQRDIYTIVDVAQTAGVIPINVDIWKADFVIGSCIKWLCGGPGAGFLWCNKDSLQQFEPKQVGWFSHANPFEMDIQNFRYHDSAYRFWGGTPSILPYIIARIGLETMIEIGIENIYQHNQQLLSLLIEQLEQDQCQIYSPIEAQNRSGTIVVDFTHNTSVDQIFEEYGIIVDYRQGYRISPHIYNTEKEIKLLVDVIAMTKDKSCHAISH